MSKLWGGRFEKETLRDVEVFTASIVTDQRLWKVDIEGSLAHVKMLGRQKIIPENEVLQIVQGLEAVQEDIVSGRMVFDPSAEDIHSEIEKALTAKIGTIAGKLHTARSRNDQVATDTRLYLRDEMSGYVQDLRALQNECVRHAEQHCETVLPGLTHMQHGQPVSLAHHLMAYVWMFQRDIERAEDTLKRIRKLPLGSAALAGTSFPLDRRSVCRDLNFAAITENSLDAVSDRDYLVETLSNFSLTMMHLSRMSEELILWSTPEFKFIELDDAVTTGSSIMPQKKNPDVAELIRGKVGRVYGALMGSLTLLKALPLSYNRDLQEDKFHLFEGIDTTRASLKLMKAMLESAQFNTDRMLAMVHGDFSNATDLADYLVTKGLAFRQAHEVVGRIVRDCLEKKIGIEDMTLAQLKVFDARFESDVITKVKPLEVMKARTTEGGTAPSRVKEQIAAFQSLRGA
jgi:argininosuccinate lyase